jgi:hypothetical protein
VVKESGIFVYQRFITSNASFSVTFQHRILEYLYTCPVARPIALIQILKATIYFKFPKIFNTDWVKAAADFVLSRYRSWHLDVYILG